MDKVGTADTALNCDNLNWPLSVGHNGAGMDELDESAAYNVLYGDGGVTFWVDRQVNRQFRITWREMLHFVQVQRVYRYFDGERGE